MALTDQESEELYNEARQLYDRYGQLKTDIRVDRSRSELNNELDAVQSRYNAIQEELRINGAPPMEEFYQIPDFDVGFYKAHKPVEEKPGDTEVFWVSVLKPRKVITIILLLFAVSTLFLISNKYIGFFIVPSSSMEPTLTPGDKLVTFRKSIYQRGDIVVLHDPVEEGAFLVKRLIALENDEIVIHDGIIQLNHKQVEEPYINEIIKYEFETYQVPEGQVFLLGDNRNYSDDGHKSRQGLPEDSIVGEVKYIYAPKDRWRAITSGAQYFIDAGL